MAKLRSVTMLRAALGLATRQASSPSGAQLVGHRREQGDGFAFPATIAATSAAQDLAIDGESLELADLLLKQPPGDDGFDPAIFV